MHALFVEVIELANDTNYGLAAAVFTENNSRAIRVAHALEAGTTWVRVFRASDFSLQHNLLLRNRSIPTTTLNTKFLSVATSSRVLEENLASTLLTRKF